MSSLKIKSLLQLYELLPEQERIIVDVLRQIITGNLASYCKEKISYNVPFFYGKKGICIVWPSTVPRGGIKKGVLLGFWYGNKLNDVNGYLTHGTNKQIFYKIYHTVEEVNEEEITLLLQEAVKLDQQW
jgi:hypothetical protein